MNKKLKVIPLGGVGEIGKNMTVIEYGDDMIVVDCGLCFPDEEMLGIDLVIPDMTYVEKNISKLRGMVITHGHEDHIGGLPYALRKFNTPVYGTKFTIALIEHKLKEIHFTEANLNCVEPGDTVKLGCMEIEFIKVNHSIAGAVLFAIKTPIGTIIHTGDFKVDYTPIDGEPTDIARIARYGSEGVLLLLSDSTNAEANGYTESEMEIGKTFEHVFDLAPGRVIVASFASNIYRVQQIADVAISFGRVVCFQGRSMQNISDVALKLGYMNLPEESVVDVENLKKYRDDQICVITTGSQGEPMSGLFRMANSSHRLNVGEGDTVIISASTIPGNEVGISKVINQLYRKGVHVVYDPMADVHVSGHAMRGELKLMLTLVKPKFFMPVHGEFRHMYQHAGIAESLGIPPENIFVTEIGDCFETDGSSAYISSNVPSGSVMIDGLGIGDIGSAVLKDRRALSQDGLFSIVLAIDKMTGEMLSEPLVTTRGFVYVRNSEELLSEAAVIVKFEASNFKNLPKTEWGSIKNNIRTRLKDYLYNKTKRTPIILPVVMEI
ncbi:MAG: ribonuclease J [Clostridia bacterium]